MLCSATGQPPAVDLKVKLPNETAAAPAAAGSGSPEVAAAAALGGLGGAGGGAAGAAGGGGQRPYCVIAAPLRDSSTQLMCSAQDCVMSDGSPNVKCT